MQASISSVQSGAEGTPTQHQVGTESHDYQPREREVKHPGQIMGRGKNAGV